MSKQTNRMEEEAPPTYRVLFRNDQTQVVEVLLTGLTWAEVLARTLFGLPFVVQRRIVHLSCGRFTYTIWVEDETPSVNDVVLFAQQQQQQQTTD